MPLKLNEATSCVSSGMVAGRHRGAVDARRRERRAVADRDLRRREAREACLAQRELRRLEIAAVVREVQVIGLDLLDERRELGVVEIVPPVRVRPNGGLVVDGAEPACGNVALFERRRGHRRAPRQCRNGSGQRALRERRAAASSGAVLLIG